MEKINNAEPYLKVSFKKGLDGMNLPFMKTEKNGYSVYFLLDTGQTRTTYDRISSILPRSMQIL